MATEPVPIQPPKISADPDHPDSNEVVVSPIAPVVPELKEPETEPPLETTTQKNKKPSTEEETEEGTEEEVFDDDDAVEEGEEEEEEEEDQSEEVMADEMMIPDVSDPFNENRTGLNELFDMNNEFDQSEAIDGEGYPGELKMEGSAEYPTDMYQDGTYEEYTDQDEEYPIDQDEAYSIDQDAEYPADLDEEFPVDLDESWQDEEYGTDMDEENWPEEEYPIDMDEEYATTVWPGEGDVYDQDEETSEMDEEYVGELFDQSGDGDDDYEEGIPDTTNEQPPQQRRLLSLGKQAVTREGFGQGYSKISVQGHDDSMNLIAVAGLFSLLTLMALVMIRRRRQHS